MIFLNNNKKKTWWINKCKLPTVEAVKYNSCPCLEIEDLWHALHSSFNMVQDWQIDIGILDKISNKHSMKWVPFSEEEFISFIAKCNNLSTPGLDKLSWRHFKSIVKDKSCLKRIINIADVCFELGYWPSHFKTSIFIVIPKPNKKLYDFPKSFRPIVLLNIIGKLIEKVINNQLQFHSISNNFIHPSQLGRLKQRLISNTGVTLTYFIQSGWVKNNMTSILTFDIA